MKIYIITHNNGEYWEYKEHFLNKETAEKVLAIYKNMTERELEQNEIYDGEVEIWTKEISDKKPEDIKTNKCNRCGFDKFVEDLEMKYNLLFCSECLEDYEDELEG